MSEQEFELGRRIARQLDRGMVEISPVVLARLQHARSSALDSMRVQPAWELAPPSGSSGLRGPLRFLNLRYLLPVAALLVMISGMVYWQQSQHIDDLVDIDAKLLAGDLPIDAYLDNGLDAWLKR